MTTSDNGRAIRQAACTCGELTMPCEGEPVRVSICHCLACQRRTGSAFGVQARYHRDQVGAVAGQPARFVRVGDAGSHITYHFCRTCGATLYWEIDALADFVAIPVGAFAESGFPPPTASVYEARKHGWVALPECIVDHWD
jgi:hypothetical protein